VDSRQTEPGGRGRRCSHPGFCFRGRLEAELAAGVEVESLRSGGLRRPGIEAAPDVCAGLKDDGLVECGSFALEVVLEEGELQVGAEVFAGFGIELNVAEVSAVAARPSRREPMGPRRAWWVWRD